jgi:hypothetical protein
MRRRNRNESEAAVRPTDHRITRRNFLALSGTATAAGSAAFLWLREPSSAASKRAGGAADTGRGVDPNTVQAQDATLQAQAGTSPAPWSDPATWPDGQGAPKPGNVVTIDRPVLLDDDVEVAGLTVSEAGSLTFQPDAGHTLTSTGNIVVYGRLTMRPAAADVTHAIRFVDVDEGAFVGGGMAPLDTDVGLWVMDHGAVDLMGTPRSGWGQSADAIHAGMTTITMSDEPLGWRAGDELVVTPTGAPREETSEEGFETAVIASVSGRTVQLRDALRLDHPAVTLRDGMIMTAEVLNLTRNVRIEAMPDGRAHVMFHADRPQSTRFVGFRHLGPRQSDGEFTKGVLGRYPLHFHICEEGSRGSIVEGAVVRDAGNHAFVPHTSHGISFVDCVSYDTFDDAYWWDQAPDTRTPGPPTNDLLYERCVAALVRSDPPFRGYRLTGFTIARGEGSVARGCVAVGVLGSANASGFRWPEGSAGIWTFEDCIAHNCRNGIFVWQNTDREHHVRSFVAYHNHAYGIDHGAYSNPYSYEDIVLHGNASGALQLHATSRDAGLRFTNMICDGANESTFLIRMAEHQFETDQPTLFQNCVFSGAQDAAFGLTTEAGERNFLEVVDCTFEGNEFWLSDNINPLSQIIWRDSTHGSAILRRSDQEGTFNPDWNARVTPA